jgi:hypothetical protein
VLLPVLVDIRLIFGRSGKARDDVGRQFRAFFESSLCSKDRSGKSQTGLLPALAAIRFVEPSENFHSIFRLRHAVHHPYLKLTIYGSILYLNTNDDPVCHPPFTDFHRSLHFDDR